MGNWLLYFKNREFIGRIRVVGKKSLVYKWEEFEVIVSYFDDNEICRIIIYKNG